MNQLTINEKYHFNIEQKEESIFIDNSEFVFDLKQLKENVFHILHENRSFTAELVSYSKGDKKAKVKINGSQYDVSFQDKYDRLLDQMGMNFSSQKSEVTLKAPMPGLVLDIMVKVGDQVNKGDNLLTLEAMKMENIIKSSGDLKVKSIEIEKGAKVDKNQILFTFH